MPRNLFAQRSEAGGEGKLWGLCARGPAWELIYHTREIADRVSPCAYDGKPCVSEGLRGVQRNDEPPRLVKLGGNPACRPRALPLVDVTT